MLSIAIPSRNEIFLNKTIKDVLEKATGEIEVFPILDGWEPPELIEDSRVKYIRIPLGDGKTHKRHGVNEMVKQAKGEFVMSLDAHCMMDHGFDEKLAKVHEPNWVQIPRRNRLDAENWCLQEQGDGRPPIDYEYIMFRPLLDFGCGLHGYKWDSRTLERMNIPIDETFEFQGSCWFMEKDWFEKMGFMQIEGYTGWGQEAEELSFTTWKNGGKVMTNKTTWYAHLHKGKKYGRMYFMSKDENKKSYDYSYDLWINKNREFFEWIIERFWPLPGWPNDWKEQLWKR